jgi:type VI secretion system secreted protein VgrG
MAYTDAQRTIQLTTPLGANVLLATSFQGREAVSELFFFHLDAMTESTTPLAFDALLGQSITVTLVLATGNRYFNGIVIGVTQGTREEVFTNYKLEIAPSVWTLTRNAQSRIFQQMAVPDILKKVFTGQQVTYQLTGTYNPREYCVQYRETDFDFASRLMEEEGIFYFFQHTDSQNTLVLGDSPQVFQDLPIAPTVIYDVFSGAGLADDRVAWWEKAQDLRSGKATLWDYEFQMPDKNCMATSPVPATLEAGTITHKLSVGGNSAFELYDYPGGFTKRYDGVSASGGDQSANLQDIFTDNARTVKIRMQQETARAMFIQGKASHAGFISGYNFTLSNHYSDNGEFTLVSVEHDARQALATGDDEFHYSNNFQAIPVALPFLPPRTTPQPFVHGPQTALVVGGPGDEIATDKYGRVKVQFHWDRIGTDDLSSSCWLRVATHWAGTQWGAIHIPRVGQEVIVAFLEGDPDQPIIVGSVYNADNMPPWTLPDNKTQSGIITRSTTGGSASNYNQIQFEDKKGSEQINVQAEKDLNTVVENNETRNVGSSAADDGSRTTVIYNNETLTVTKGNQTTTVQQGDQSTEIKMGNQSNLVDMGNQTNEIKMGNQTETLDMGNQTTTLKMGNQSTTLNMGNQSTTLDLGNITTQCSLGSITLQAMQSITLQVGANQIVISMTGVTINGMMVSVEADAMCQIQGAITMIN